MFPTGFCAGKSRGGESAKLKAQSSREGTRANDHGPAAECARPRAQRGGAPEDLPKFPWPRCGRMSRRPGTLLFIRIGKICFRVVAARRLWSAVPCPALYTDRRTIFCRRRRAKGASRSLAAECQSKPRRSLRFFPSLRCSERAARQPSGRGGPRGGSEHRRDGKQRRESRMAVQSKNRAWTKRCLLGLAEWLLASRRSARRSR